MGSIFLSASIPLPDRGKFHEDANPFLIQFAVRELLSVCLGRRHVIWGGHPAITPMVWAVCEDLGVDYSTNVTLYQSQLFEDIFPEENKRFNNVILVPAVSNNRAESLKALREKMFENDFECAVFIGGMEGVIDEYNMLNHLQPEIDFHPVYSPGGAGGELARMLGKVEDRIDFARFFSEKLGIGVKEERHQIERNVRREFKP